MSDIAKVKIKFGVMELEYEGSSDYLKSDLGELLANIIQLGQSAGMKMDGTGEKIRGSMEPLADMHGIPTLSTESVAAKLDVKTGPELAFAAASKMTVIDNKKSFSREEILQEMKTASAYYKETQSKNLSQSLKTLITSQKLNSIGNSQYSLSKSQIDEVKQKLI